MNWIDFNIICVGARKAKIFINEAYSIDVMNRDSNKAVKCYVENWDILNRVQGIWYELWSLNQKYDNIIKSTWCLNNICDDKENLHGYQLYIEENDKQLVFDILNFYINCSPIKKIIVLFRHQGYETESIKNAMSVNDFLGKLINKEIYGNVGYILSN
ncbi:MAG: hypothetical protein J6B04_00865 [Clostridia bacterium]|nr:hypothetical protein [Clostridia bacterium]